MSKHRMTWAAAYGCAAAAAVWVGLAGGCGAKQAPTMPTKPPEANPQPAVENDVETRVAELQRQSAELGRQSQALPGATAAENRQQLQQVFGTLAQILPMLAGPDASGVFTHQVSLVSDTRTQLAGSSGDLNIDPIVDRGLRAVRNALTEAAQADYYQEPRVTQGLDALNKGIENLDVYQGQAHSLAVATAVQQSSQVITAMTNALATRLEQGGGSPGTPTAPAPGAGTPAAATPAATAPSPSAPPATPAESPASPTAPPAATPPSAAPADPVATPPASTPPVAEPGAPTPPPAGAAPAPADPAAPTPPPGSANK